MKLSSKPLQNPSVLSRQFFGNELVLVNADSATSIALTNQTAVAVWELADGINSVEDIIDAIKLQFQCVPDKVSNDVKNLLDILATDGFIGFEWEEQT